MIKLVIPRVPSSYNEIVTWHWGKRRDYNQMWHDEVRIAFLEYLQKQKDPFSLSRKKPFKKARIDFYIYFPDKHRRDKVNYAQGLKAVLDTLSRLEIIVDDNWTRIEDQYYQRYDKENPRTEIIIEEIK